MAVTNTTIRAADDLTARWAETVGTGTVFSAAGVWPLLAFLADGATGTARQELAEAIGLPADEAAGAARELLTTLGRTRGLDAAIGLWTKRTLELHDRWKAGLPTGAHGVLTGDEVADRGALDKWAAQRTGGLIEEMPVRPTRDTELVLASALALRTRWRQPFDARPLRPHAGPWRSRTLRGLRRQGGRPDGVGVAAAPEGQVTGVTVEGETGIDVQLLLGEEGMTPGQVLSVGVRAPRHPATAGPALRTEERPSLTPGPPTLEVTTVAFETRAHHDLLRLHGLFGLTTARDASSGHFPGVSAQPLAIDSAEQSALARFDALGFEAAAVTAMAAAPGGAPPTPRHTTTVTTATFDRPFGFLAVHRETRLVLAAGWVADPKPFREDDYR